MKSWNDLSMADRAKYIKLGVDQGIRNIDHIRSAYNKYGQGGFSEQQEQQTAQLANKGYENITGFSGKIKLVFPDGTTGVYNNSIEAQKELERRGGRAVPISTTKVTSNGINKDLAEVEVIGRKEGNQDHYSNDPVMVGILNGEYNGRKFEPTEANIKYFTDLYKKDQFVKQGCGQDQWAKVWAGHLLAGIAAYPAAPYILGAANLWGAYEGVKGLYQGIPRTTNHVLNGEYVNAAKSLIGNVFDGLAAAPAVGPAVRAARIAAPYATSATRAARGAVSKNARLAYAMEDAITPTSAGVPFQVESVYARPYMSLDQFEFSPAEEIVTHADNGNFRGAFTGQGAYIQDGVLYPGQARLPGQRNFTWWNENGLYTLGVNKKPFSRIFLAKKSDIPGLQRVREMKEAVGQWRPGSRKGFVLKSEMVTPEPTPTSRMAQYNLDPYESLIGNNLYVRSDIPTTQIYGQEVFPYRNPTQFQQGVRTSGRHQVIGQGPVRGSRNVDVPSSPGPIRYHPSRITLDAQTSTGETLHLQNYQNMKLFPRGEYRPDGIRFDRVTNYTEGFRPNVQGKWINPENGIPITDWTSQYNWPMEYPSRRWLPTSDNNWVWTDLEKIPITLFHKNGGKLKHEKD